MCTLPSRGPGGVGSHGFLSTDNGAGGMVLTNMGAIADICAWLPPCASIQKIPHTRYHLPSRHLQIVPTI